MNMNINKIFQNMRNIYNNIDDSEIKGSIYEDLLYTDERQDFDAKSVKLGKLITENLIAKNPAIGLASTFDVLYKINILLSDTFETFALEARLREEINNISSEYDEGDILQKDLELLSELSEDVRDNYKNLINETEDLTQILSNLHYSE